MGSQNADDQKSIAPSSDSFWEVGNFKRTTRRIEDGCRQCDEFAKFIEERAQVDKAYAKNLKEWSKKWEEHIEKGPEYGTVEAAWLALTLEASRRHVLHMSVRERLLTEVVAKMKEWQKDNLHKTVMHLREKKDMDELFKKAQKPWAKQLEKVEKAKVDYHSACKQERSAVNHERNTAGANGEVHRKAVERLEKCTDEVARARYQYETALDKLSQLNPDYVSQMGEVFDQCQQMEEKRLAHLKQLLLSAHQCLDISTVDDLPDIYRDVEAGISQLDYKKDLQWWSDNHGANMTMQCPVFEEYVEQEARSSSGSIRRLDSLLPRGVSDRHHQQQQQQERHAPAVTKQQSMPASQSKESNGSLKNAAAAGRKSIDVGALSRGTTGASNGATVTTPDCAEEWDDDDEEGVAGGGEAGGELVDNGEPGVPVEALYNYDGVEDDELSFQKGDRFEKLEDEDEQGWCKGRRDGRVGLYPANYVKTI